MTPEQIDTLMNQIDPPDARIVAHCVPTRAIRVIALKGDLTFRVEQLEPGAWKWRTISTHSGDEPFESFGFAVDDAVRMQARLKEKIKLAQHENNMARVKALHSTSNLTPTESLT
jgi:hypothetical protein